MKLYATIQSNRAKKGQGGDYLFIEILDQDKKEIARVYVKDEMIHFSYSSLSTIYGVTLNSVSIKEKGKQKKDEKHVHDWDNYGKCTICGKWNTQSMF